LTCWYKAVVWLSKGLLAIVFYALVYDDDDDAECKHAAHVRREAREIFFVVTSTFWLYKYN